MTRCLATAVALTWALLSAPTPVGACSCRETSSNPCAAAWAVDAVFVAEVVETSPAESSRPNGSDPMGLFSTTRNRMRVSEVFRGDIAGQVDVYTPAASSCAFGFESEVPYVVYANRGSDGRLTTGMCLGTHRVRADTEELEHLRAMTSTTTSASIVGQARSSIENAQLEGMRVIAESDGARFETTTGRDGQYTLPVPLGSYRVTYAVGEGLHAGEARVNVAHDRSCVAADAYVIPDGRLTGRVVDTTGTPVANMSVFVTYAQPGRSLYTGRRAMTNAEGVYRVTLVPPGLFLLGTGVESSDLSDQPRIFHPGVVDRTKSTRVALELGERKTLPDLVVPVDVDLFTVTGTVRGPSGAPVAGATVTLNAIYVTRNSTRPSVREAATPVTSDSEGHFTISAITGRYLLEGWLNVPQQNRTRQGKTDPFDGAGRVEVTLTLPD